MSINTIEYAKIFMEALDEQLVAGATSGWMEENSGQVQYTGGNEVKIPKIELNGLGTICMILSAVSVILYVLIINVQTKDLQQK